MCLSSFLAWRTRIQQKRFGFLLWANIPTHFFTPSSFATLWFIYCQVQFAFGAFINFWKSSAWREAVKKGVRWSDSFSSLVQIADRDNSWKLLEQKIVLKPWWWSISLKLSIRPVFYALWLISWTKAKAWLAKRDCFISIRDWIGITLKQRICPMLQHSLLATWSLHLRVRSGRILFVTALHARASNVRKDPNPTWSLSKRNGRYMATKPRIGSWSCLPDLFLTLRSILIDSIYLNFSLLYSPSSSLSPIVSLYKPHSQPLLTIDIFRVVMYIYITLITSNVTDLSFSKLRAIFLFQAHRNSVGEFIKKVDFVHAMY